MVRRERRPNAWLPQGGLRSGLEARFSPNRFRHQIPAGSWPSRRKAEDWDRMERRFIWRAHRFRTLVARRLSAEKLAELDTRRRRLPGDPAHGADFWRQQLVGLLGR